MSHQHCVQYGEVEVLEESSNLQQERATNAEAMDISKPYIQQIESQD